MHWRWMAPWTIMCVGITHRIAQQMITNVMNSFLSG